MKERFQRCECVSDEPQMNLPEGTPENNKTKILGKIEAGIRIGITYLFYYDSGQL